MRGDLSFTYGRLMKLERIFEKQRDFTAKPRYDEIERFAKADKSSPIRFFGCETRDTREISSLYYMSRTTGDAFYIIVSVTIQYVPRCFSSTWPFTLTS